MLKEQAKAVGSQPTGPSEAPGGYVTRILAGRRVSRIRYVSDTYTCSIRHGYVSWKYPNFYYFRNYQTRGHSLGDTDQPNNKGAYPCPRHPNLDNSRTAVHASRHIPARLRIPCSLPAGHRRRASASALPARSLHPCSLAVSGSAPSDEFPPLRRGSRELP